MVNQEATTIRYIGIFTISNIVLMVIFNVLLYGFNIDLGSGVNFGMVVASACIAANKFVSEKHRVPTRSEKAKLVWGSLSISMLLGVVGFYTLAAVLQFDAKSEFLALVSSLPTGLLLGIILVVVLSYYFLLNFCYGGFARFNLKKYE